MERSEMLLMTKMDAGLNPGEPKEDTSAADELILWGTTHWPCPVRQSAIQANSCPQIHVSSSAMRKGVKCFGEIEKHNSHTPALLKVEEHHTSPSWHRGLPPEWMHQCLKPNCLFENRMCSVTQANIASCTWHTLKPLRQEMAMILVDSLRVS